jgi:hypothetical protein
MNQALYAHMNNKRKKERKKKNPYHQNKKRKKKAGSPIKITQENKLGVPLWEPEEVGVFSQQHLETASLYLCHRD